MTPGRPRDSEHADRRRRAACQRSCPCRHRPDGRDADLAQPRRSARSPRRAPQPADRLARAGVVGGRRVLRRGRDPRCPGRRRARGSACLVGCLEVGGQRRLHPPLPRLPLGLRGRRRRPRPAQRPRPAADAPVTTAPPVLLASQTIMAYCMPMNTAGRQWQPARQPAAPAGLRPPPHAPSAGRPASQPSSRPAATRTRHLLHPCPGFGRNTELCPQNPGLGAPGAYSAARRRPAPAWPMSRRPGH